MCSKLWRVTHALLTLAAVGCCAWLAWREYHRSPTPDPARQPDAERHTLTADDSLRTLLDVRSFGCNFEVPEGMDHGVIALLRYEDGKFVGRRYGDAWGFWLRPGEPRRVSFDMAWGRGLDGRPRFVGTTSGSNWKHTWDAKADEEFFSKLDGGGSNTITGGSEEIRGYRVLGHLTSAKPRATGRAGISGTLQIALENRQTVAVIGLKMFPTSEQAGDWQLGREPADP